MTQKNQLTHQNFFKEVSKLLKDFVRRDFIKDNILEQPKGLKNNTQKLNITALIMSCIASLFSYLTLAGNYAISHGYIVLGIALYMFFNARSIVNTIYNQWETNLQATLKFSQEDVLTIKGNKILSKVSWNVYQKEDDNKWKQSTNEEITSINNSWNDCNTCCFQCRN